MSKYLPLSNGVPSYWPSIDDNFSIFRISTALPEEVDTVIVGSSHAGAAIAYYMLE